MDLRVLFAAGLAGMMFGCGQAPAQSKSEASDEPARVLESTPIEYPDVAEAAPAIEVEAGATADSDEAMPLDGPVSSYGVLETRALGALSLEHEAGGLMGRALRVQEITIEPGGVVAVHRHDQQPGVAYILEGEFIEYRSDQEEPVKRGVGSVIFEENDIVHWWANESGANARALLVEIVPE